MPTTTPVSTPNPGLEKLLAEELMALGLSRQTDLSGDAGRLMAVATAALRRYAELLDSIETLRDVLERAVEQQANRLPLGSGAAQSARSKEDCKLALNTLLAATSLRAGAPYLVSEGYGHCFVGKHESITRWAAHLDTEPLQISAAQVLQGGKWVDLHGDELLDLQADVRDNEVRTSPADFDAACSSRWPDWAGDLPDTPPPEHRADELPCHEQRLRA